MRPPGTLLLAFARLLFDESVLSRAVHPTIADLQEEVRQAGTDRRRRLLARWRGYTAFWILVLTSPVAFWSWPMTPSADRRALLNVSVLLVAALAVAAGLMTSGATVALAAVEPLAFMAGPVALLITVAIGRLRGPTRFSVGLAEAALLILLSATVAVTTGTAVFVTAFAGIARTGAGSISMIHDAWVTSVERLVFAAVVTAASLLVIAALTRRAARLVPTARVEPPAMTGRLAVALATVIGGALVAVDLLLRSYSWTLALLVRMFSRGANGAPLTDIADTSALLAHNIALVFAGGVVLTVLLPVAGALTWRVSRNRTPHAILTWASRTALVVVIVGAWWHGGQARAALDAYRELPQVNVPRPPVDNRM